MFSYYVATLRFLVSCQRNFYLFCVFIWVDGLITTAVPICTMYVGRSQNRYKLIRDDQSACILHGSAMRSNPGHLYIRHYPSVPR